MRFPSDEIDRAGAAQLQAASIKEGVLLLWCVTWGTEDYGEVFVARPQFPSATGVRVLPVHLVGKSLEDIREKLPPGLTCTRPQAGDDPVIVEVWL